jgi:rubrerythrin
MAAAAPPAGSLYAELAADADAERLDATFAALERREGMMEQMTSTTVLEVSAWRCGACGTTGERPAEACRAAHPAALARVRATKRWWQCARCAGRFSTVGQRYPTGSRCPRCDNPAEFKAVGMAREARAPPAAVAMDGQGSTVAAPELLLPRGVEQPWVN